MGDVDVGDDGNDDVLFSPISNKGLAELVFTTGGVVLLLETTTDTSKLQPLLNNISTISSNLSSIVATLTTFVEVVVDIAGSRGCGERM